MHRDIIEKLQDARTAIAAMNTAGDFPSFRRAFNQCLAALRSVGYKLDGETKRALRKSGRKADVPNYQNWWKTKETQLRTDPLMLWTVTVRDGDTHLRDEGVFNHRLETRFTGTDDFEPGPPGADLVINADGAVWVVGMGTVREHRTPAKFRPGAPATMNHEVGVANAPTEHLGKTLTQNDPLTLCQLALEYWEGLVEEAGKLWW
jgi:hypothetical protein